MLMITTDHLKAQILEQLKTQELVRVSASEEEFFALSAQLPFKIEYHDSEIITMGLASYWHEVLTMTLGGIFYTLFSNKKEFTVSGSNTGIKVPKFEGGYYLPDIVVVKGAPEFKPDSTAIITSPHRRANSTYRASYPTTAASKACNRPSSSARKKKWCRAAPLRAAGRVAQSGFLRG